MLASTGEALANQPAKLKREPFEGVDRREAGRKGGLRSGEVRRLRPLSVLERGIVESRNGAAKAKLLDVKLREQEELLAERRRRDEVVNMLILEEAELLHQVEELETQREQARSELVELLGRQDLLRASVGAEQHELVVHLRELHARGALEPVLVELDLFDVVDDEADGAART